jgi:hypothetical protein
MCVAHSSSVMKAWQDWRSNSAPPSMSAMTWSSEGRAHAHDLVGPEGGGAREQEVRAEVLDELRPARPGSGAARASRRTPRSVAPSARSPSGPRAR